MVNMTNADYLEYVKTKSPKSPKGKDMLKAFVSGGLICVIGELILHAYIAAGLTKELAGTATSMTLVFAGASLTGLGVYDRFARHCGAGTLVPITGFANSIVSPALEFKSEGYVAGMSAKMFVIAGPVLVFGVTASIIYGLLLCLFT